MLKRTLRLSTITLCILCTFFLICTGVFAATRQATQVSTTVQFTPGILAKVYVLVDGGAETLIFDNTTTSPTLNTAYFTLEKKTTPANGTKNNQTIQFKIYNYNNSSAITAQVYYDNDNHKGWYYADTNGDEYTTITAFNANAPVTTITTASIAAKSGETVSSQTTNTFHIISLFDNVPTSIIIKLTDNIQA